MKKTENNNLEMVIYEIIEEMIELCASNPDDFPIYHSYIAKHQAQNPYKLGKGQTEETRKRLNTPARTIYFEGRTKGGISINTNRFKEKQKEILDIIAEIRRQTDIPFVKVFVGEAKGKYSAIASIVDYSMCVDHRLEGLHLYYVVLHELVHTIARVGHVRNCLLMGVKYQKTLATKQDYLDVFYQYVIPMGISKAEESNKQKKEKVEKIKTVSVSKNIKFADLSKENQVELLEFMSSLKKGDRFFGKSKDALAEILSYAEVKESPAKAKPKEKKVVRDTPKKDSPINSLGDFAFLATVRNETSNKFWGIKLKSSSRAVICWGRIGTKGQSQETDTGDAVNRARKKIKEGYSIEFVGIELIGYFGSNMKKSNPLSKEKTVFGRDEKGRAIIGLRGNPFENKNYKKDFKYADIVNGKYVYGDDYSDKFHFNGRPITKKILEFFIEKVKHGDFVVLPFEMGKVLIDKLKTTDKKSENYKKMIDMRDDIINMIPSEYFGDDDSFKERLESVSAYSHKIPNYVTFENLPWLYDLSRELGCIDYFNGTWTEESHNSFISEHKHLLTDKKSNPLSKEKTVFLTYRGVSISIKSNVLLNIASGVEALVEDDQEYLEKRFSDITKEIAEVLEHRESYDSMTKDERTDLSKDIVLVAILDLYLNNTPLDLTETTH